MFNILSILTKNWLRLLDGSSYIVQLKHFLALVWNFILEYAS
jgi:hypothetical protein